MTMNGQYIVELVKMGKNNYAA